MNTLNKITILLTSLILSACSMNPKHNHLENEKKFPDVNQSYLKKVQYYDVAQINKVHIGQDKDQVRFLLGNPHFGTGLFNVKTWQYLIGLKQSHSSQVEFCQLRVDFNKQYLVEKLTWKDQKCEDILNQTSNQSSTLNHTKTVQINQNETVKILNFDDILFNFNRASIHDVVGGAPVINRVINDIQNNFKKINRISVIGFADKIGQSQPNIRLSEARARNIADALMNQGITAKDVYVKGKGSTNAFVKCKGKKSDLIHCLEPNRRVVLSVIGE